MEFFVNKPYPKVQVERKNIKYAKLLLEDYSGINGELTEICQYIYQKFDTSDEDNTFSFVLSKIAIVEMKHLELLGKTIKLLGLNPKFINTNKGYYDYWNSSFIDYNTNKTQMLKLDIEKEKLAINNYLKDIQLIKDKYIQELLYRIIEDEELHIKCFYQLLGNGFK